MFFTKSVSQVFVALAAIAAVAALPAKHDETTTCSFVLHPDRPVDASNLLGEFNYAIGRTLAIAVPSHTISGGGNATWVDNGDDTFNVQKTIGAVGETAASTAAIIHGWAGVSLLGPTANWFVESVSCV